MKAWFLIDTTENTGRSSIKGVFLSEGESKIFLADYLMEKQPDNKECEAVLLLDGWDLSPGAMREVYFAHKNGIRVTESLEKIDEWRR